MSTTTAGILFLALLIVALAAVHVPFGDYMYRVYSSDKHSRVERVIYRLIGADPKSEQSWGAYARSVLAFSAISILFLFIFQLVQGKLPLHLNDPATPMTPALAWNTAVSFVTNTNWQAYSGESTHGPSGADGRPGRAELRVGRGRHGGRDRAGARIRPQAHRRSGQLLGRPGPWHAAHPAADLRRRRDHPDRRRRDPELPPATTRSSTPSPAASRPSPVARSPARRPSRSSAPTAAASTTPTPRIRSRTRTRGPTGWRSSCCWSSASRCPARSAAWSAARSRATRSPRSCRRWP